MGSGVDLGKLIPSVLFGFFVFAAFTLTFTEMGHDMGSPLTINSTFDFNNSLTAAKKIDKIVMDNTTSPNLISSFFPGIPLMMNLVTIMKDTTTGVFKDIYNAMDRFFTLLGAGGAGGDLIRTLEVILITAITISIVFIILAAIFRQQKFKEQ